jgi:2-polyprenyl-3-methyl-5-hydroxy-6-metoxy-1,4-benzoquinol methylase
VDVSERAIGYLRRQCREFPEITGEAADYRSYIKKAGDIDIVICSLFCHHLTNKELEEMLIQVKQNINTGVVINDLQRNWMAYYSTIIFTHLFNGSLLAKNDGPVSVLRGFKQHELKALLKRTGWKNYSIQRRLGFRFLIVGQV